VPRTAGNTSTRSSTYSRPGPEASARASQAGRAVNAPAYTVDRDDLFASFDLGLQTSLVHLLRERAETKDYARRMGIVQGSGALLPNAEFSRSHAHGIDSELALLRDFFGDPGIRIINPIAPEGPRRPTQARVPRFAGKRDVPLHGAVGDD
jgi:hypothetical protein